MSNPLICIVIVNYNGAKYQNECIDSILASDYQDFRIIVVDNASTDNSMELLNEFKDGRIEKIFAGDNLGVAEGNNIGIRRSIEMGAEATLLLNNDTVIPPNTIGKMVAYLNKDQVVTPKIYYWGDKNVLWYGGGHFDMQKGNNEHDFLKCVDDNLDIADYCDYSPSCCLLVKNKVFEEIGLIDPIYFMYYDDADFCMRLKIRGIPIRIAKDACMYHKVSLSTGGSDSKFVVYYMSRNRFYFLKKFRAQFGIKPYLFAKYSRYVRYIQGVLKHDNRRYIRRGMRDFRKGNMGRCDNL